jgi:hypothetical protein
MIFKRRDLKIVFHINRHGIDSSMRQKRSP